MNTKGWNIFARELECILKQHGNRLGQLDDRAGIHPQKVSRLQKSLCQPKSFPVLNPEELEEVALAFDLDEDEMLRLRAAVLTTAIEEILIGRIHQNDALLAAEQIFFIIFEAINKHKRDKDGLGSIRNDA